MPRINLNLLAMLLLAILTSRSSAAGHPLFESDEPFSLILELPARELLKRAKDKPTVPGVLRYTEIDGTDVVLDIAVSTRGNSRLKQCRYPPLSINLKRKQVKSTLFAGQNKLKLVTLCRDTTIYRRYLSQEFALYKIYNLLTEYSFRARMLDVTYRDSSGHKKGGTQPAFFIESDKEAAERLGMTTVKSNFVNVSQLDGGQLSIYSLFQFMIGNTDWSVRKGPDTKGCCHNGKVIAPLDSHNGWVVLPYDFDQAGLINTSYAMPSESLPIKSVRQRYYRGYCGTDALLQSTIATFNNSRAAIEHLFGSGSDGTSRNKRALEYVLSFYEIVNDPKKRQKKIVDACRRVRN